MIKTPITCFLATAAILSSWVGSPERSAPFPVVGSPHRFVAAYRSWHDELLSSGAANVVSIGLAWSRALSTEACDATGALVLDRSTGEVRVDISGPATTERLDIWLIDNGTEGTVAPEATDTIRLLGTISLDRGHGSLTRSLSDPDFADMEVDLVIASRHDEPPTDSILLSGMPSVFQRLADAASSFAGPALMRQPRTAATHPVSQHASVLALATLVATGESLFFSETFAGNGRTCGTCHPAENNFTIDPAFIATRPANDPLFVAEFLPALDSSRNGGLPFESPIAMRTAGLILENLDGFDDLPNRFTMRSVPHLLGLSRTMTPPAGGNGPADRTGWSGDGAPGQGSLREFALGAVKQHFTRSMGRTPNIDFRLPTDSELDALEAFQLSLGRSQEVDLAALVLRDAEARAGQTAFSRASCNTCHDNAGANRGGENLNFATGTEAFVRHHPDPTGQVRPPDGGLGTNGSGGSDTVVPTPEPDDPTVFSFGDKTFNVPSLVEFADTMPAFHNNLTLHGPLANTVEGAIAFYETPEFQSSPNGFVVGFLPGEVARIGKFLRVLNALENRRSADAYVQRAVAILTAFGDLTQLTRALDLARAECVDAIQVLQAVGLHNDAIEAFVKAGLEIDEARSGNRATRIATLNRVRTRYLEIARTSMQF